MGKKRKSKKRGKVESRAYEAALSVPSRRHVVGANLSHDAAVEREQGRLRDWGRYLDENTPIAISVLDEWVNSTVGKGIVTIPRPLREDGSIDEALGARLIARWRRWIRKADVTGELHWHKAQRIACRGWGRDGETFVNHVGGRDRGYPFEPGDTPYRIELLESELCPRNLTEGAWRQGVRHDEWNRPTAYAIFKRHPGDQGIVGSGLVTLSSADLKQVPAESITHLKMAKRWPATRGVSILHGVIATLYDVKDLEDSERQKNRNLAAWVAAIQRGPDYQGVDDEDSQGDRYIAIEGGSIIDSLRMGESIVGVGPDYPIANMPDHIADQVRRVCSGTGVRFSSVSRRYDGSYSAQRQELVESIGHAEVREDEFVQGFVRRVYENWALMEFMGGEVALPPGMTIERAVNAEYRGPAVPWIDQLKEAQADVLLVKEGLATLDQIRIKRGAPEELIGQPAPQQRAPAQLSLLRDDDEDEEAA